MLKSICPIVVGKALINSTEYTGVVIFKFPPNGNPMPAEKPAEIGPTAIDAEPKIDGMLFASWWIITLFSY